MMSNNQKVNLTEEGSITFWIKINTNPIFSDPNSNINFLHKKDVGNVFISVLKEGISLRVVVENSKYGISRMESDISTKLQQDMMVAITWSSDISKLTINGEFVSQSKFQ